MVGGKWPTLVSTCAGFAAGHQKAGFPKGRSSHRAAESDLPSFAKHQHQHCSALLKALSSLQLSLIRALWKITPISSCQQQAPIHNNWKWERVLYAKCDRTLQICSFMRNIRATSSLPAHIRSTYSIFMAAFFGCLRCRSLFPFYITQQKHSPSQHVPPSQLKTKDLWWPHLSWLKPTTLQCYISVFIFCHLGC